MGRPFLQRPTCQICGKVCKGLGRVFCSYKCRGYSERGQQKPYMQGNTFAHRGDNVTVWAHYKRMQKLVGRGPCEECGSEEQLVLHHVDHNPRNTVQSNLMRLCRPCHASHHHGHKALKARAG